MPGAPKALKLCPVSGSSGKAPKTESAIRNRLNGGRRVPCGLLAFHERQRARPEHHAKPSTTIGGIINVLAIRHRPSHGCIGLPANFSELLFSVNRLGTSVIIADQETS